ncbi:MAG: disulfide bond formation protein B [Acidimicrobiales bacterium]
MSTDTGTLFLALLALGALAAVAVSAVLACVSRVSDAARRGFDAVRASVAGQGPALAWIVAAVATGGSLWLSEGAGFPPCELCWYQRIAMYPLVVVLGVAGLRRDSGVRWYAIPVATVGGLVSTWHVLVERFPSLESAVSCDPANPCSIRWVERFAFLTIPTMALIAFALIITVLLLDPGPQDIDKEPPS